MGDAHLPVRSGETERERRTVRCGPWRLTPSQKFCRLGRSSADGLVVTTYSESGAVNLSRFLTLLLFSLFLLLPIAVIGYRAVGHAVGIALVLVFYLLSCVISQVVDRRAEVQLFLIFAYGAILSTLLQGLFDGS